MKRIERVVTDYLSKYGQPQTYASIVQAAADAGEKLERADLEAMADAKLIGRADGGVDNRGEPVTLYVPAA